MISEARRAEIRRRLGGRETRKKLRASIAGAALDIDSMWKAAQGVTGPIDVVDMFSGCGGMSAGFQAVNGLFPAFRLALAVITNWGPIVLVLASGEPLSAFFSAATHDYESQMTSIIGLDRIRACSIQQVLSLHVLDLPPSDSRDCRRRFFNELTSMYDRGCQRETNLERRAVGLSRRNSCPASIPASDAGT
jgi:hypothetical protein